LNFFLKKRMNWTAIIIVILGILQFGYSFFYFGLVFLNSVFTFSSLPPGDVPWYYTSGLWVNNMQRYNLEWWLLALFIFDVLVPFAVISGYLFELKRVKDFRYVVYGYLFWDAILQLRIIYRIVQYTTCASWQICRNEDPTGNPASPNLMFQFILFGNVAWIFIWAIWVFVFSQIKSNINNDIKGILRHSLAEWGLNMVEISDLIEILNNVKATTDKNKKM